MRDAKYLFSTWNITEKMKVQEFLNTKLVNYASYDNIRSIASCIDGLKNAGRKVLYTVHDKKIKDKIKVSQLASKCAEYSDYLHGDVSLQGVLVTLAQDYTGTNNLPLLQKFGNFGTRSAHSASAPRYIFTKGSDAFFKLFKYEDDAILEQQTFEGNKIEPKFYVPTLPMLLINGSEGVSTGFAQKILSRNPTNIKKYIENHLRGIKNSNDLLNVWYNGFCGDIVNDVECKNRWFIKGKIEHVEKNQYLISEIPFSYSLTEYLKILDDLQDSGKILRYANLSDGNNVLKFKVYVPKNTNYTISDMLDDFKLVKTLSENYTCIDENNRIREFNSAKEIIDHYIEVKLEYLEKRKKHLLESLLKELSILKSKKLFIDLYINKHINILNVPKKSIENTLELYDDIVKLDGTYEYLLNMPIYSLTSDKISALQKSVSNLEKELKKLKNQDVKEIWLGELKLI